MKNRVKKSKARWRNCRPRRRKRKKKLLQWNIIPLRRTKKTLRRVYFSAKSMDIIKWAAMLESKYKLRKSSPGSFSRSTPLCFVVWSIKRQVSPLWGSKSRNTDGTHISSKPRIQSRYQWVGGSSKLSQFIQCKLMMKMTKSVWSNTLPNLATVMQCFMHQHAWWAHLLSGSKDSIKPMIAALKTMSHTLDCAQLGW